MGPHQRLRVGKRRVRSDGDGIDDHAGFELLDLPHFLGLQFRCQIAVDHAHAASLRHGDGEARFGDCIHGCGEQWQVEFDIGSDAGANIGLAGHNLGMTGLEQDIIKCQCQRACRGFNDFCHDQFPCNTGNTTKGRTTVVERRSSSVQVNWHGLVTWICQFEKT